MEIPGHYINRTIKCISSSNHSQLSRSTAPPSYGRANNCETRHRFRLPIPKRAISTFINGEQRGPYFIAQVRGMWSTGSLTADTLWWIEGMDGWSQIQTLPLSIQPASVPQRVSTETERSLKSMPDGRFSCPHCHSPKTICERDVNCAVLIIIFVSLGLGLIMIPFLPYSCRCRACGHKWKS